MHPEQRALLNGIITNPNDNVARLVYADWLEENGQVNDAIRIRKHVETSFRYVSYPPRDVAERIVWRRGFMQKIFCTMAQFLKHGPLICSLHPIMRVVITDKEPVQIAGLGMIEFVWVFFAELEDQSHVLPNQLSQDQLFRVPFKSVSDANEWLSARCIAWARERAAAMSAS